MKYPRQLIPLIIAGASVAGCGGSSGGSTSSTASAPTSSTPDTPAMPAPAPQTADFTMFIKEQLAATSETTAPVEINGMTFVFNDNDNPAAFDDVLPPQTP